ncbi:MULTISPECIES: hypothetical protein [unclassified Streptomyces]|uniref:hypothetical protein n=1 Tax=unclassified Streptomyces TaxID=2593676 RepID=UPI00131793BB|nr:MULTISPECIES: hypothetical protein [unclassified Streptomyces]QHC32914.1 hypothetical protein GR129_33225 [Streptomyces sp. HF10]WKE73400.1 hypothetical protein QHG49_32550 [Streptomyces sp. WP-1]
MRGSVVGTAVTLAAAALLTAGTTTASASPPTASVSPTARAGDRVLVDCFSHRNVRPTDFILACGDGNSRLKGLNWTSWGAGGATGTGTNWVNDCKPYCAAGTFHPYPVVIRLSGGTQWKKHPSFDRFTQLTVTYSGARPQGFQHVMSYPLWDGPTAPQG